MKISVIYNMAFILFCATTAVAQKRVHYKNAPFDKTFTKCEKPPTFGNDNLSLQKFFADKLQTSMAKNTGQIKISLFIDTAGKTTCEYVENNSNFDIKKNPLNSIINKMPNWNAAFQNNRKVNCVELIFLTFNDNDLAVTYRMGRD